MRSLHHGLSSARFEAGLEVALGRDYAHFFVTLFFFVGNEIDNILIIYTIRFSVVLGVDKRR